MAIRTRPASRSGGKRQGLRDRAAHRVADDDRRLSGHRVEESVEPLRVRGDARPAPAAERPVPRQVGREKLGHVGELVELPRPELRGSARAVHQDERPARPASSHATGCPAMDRVRRGGPLTGPRRAR